MKTIKNTLRLDRFIFGFILLVSSILPFEKVFTHFSLDETSRYIPPLKFETVIVGFDSSWYFMILLLTSLCFVCYVFGNWYIFEFSLVLVVLIYLILLTPLVVLNFHSMRIGFYLSLFASGYLIFTLIRGIFYKNGTSE